MIDYMADSICISKNEILAMTKLVGELQDRLESFELANDAEFMKSLKKSDEEVNNRNSN
jgi:hypothetical protein